MNQELIQMQTLDQLVQWYISQGDGGFTRGVNPEPHGMVLLVPDVYPAIPTDLSAQWTVHIRPETRVILSQPELKAFMAAEREQLGPERAIFGSSHLGLVARFVDYPNEVILVTLRDKSAPTWPECLATPGGYPGSLFEFLNGNITGIREAAEEILIWSVADQKVFGFLAEHDYGPVTRHFGLVDHAGAPAVSVLPLLPATSEGDSLSIGFPPQTRLPGLLQPPVIRAVFPVYDKVNVRYDCVHIRRTVFPVSMDDCRLYQTEVRWDTGDIIPGRPLGWYDPLEKRLVAAWRDGERINPEMPEEGWSMTPTLDGLAHRLNRSWRYRVESET